jgi:hypothetical protein
MNMATENDKGAMTLKNLTVICSKDKDLARALQRIDLATLRHCAEVMRTTWPEILRAERKKKIAEYESLKDIYFLAGQSAARQIDEAGVTKAVGALVHHLNGFSYAANVHNLALEHVILVDSLGIPPSKVAHVWKFADAHKADAIKKMSKAGFTLEPLVKSARRSCDSPGGEAWQHSSPIKWLHVAGVYVTVSNVAYASTGVLLFALGSAVIGVAALEA